MRQVFRRMKIGYARDMENRKLKTFYDKVYAKGERKHYTSLMFSGDKVPPAKDAVLKLISWKNKEVLDAGCGTGEMPFLIAKKGAKRIVGIDYSQSAIQEAEKNYHLSNLSFLCADLQKVKGTFDVIVSLGTIEHIDDPLAALRRLKKLLKPGGSLIVTCPNWTNPRGYILMALRILFDANITLADLHYLTPVEMEAWAKKLGMTISWKTVEQEWGHGEKMIRDLARRLPNVARDSTLPTDARRIAAFIKWLGVHALPFEGETRHGGAVGVYHMRLR